MDSDPHLSNQSISEIETFNFKGNDDPQFAEELEGEPLILKGTYVALLGLAISFIMMGIPFLVVFTEKPFSRGGFVPNIDRNGSKSSLSIPSSRISKSSS